MHRFYTTSPQNISQDKITLQDKQQVHHIRDVLRLKIKERVIVFDGQGKEYDCLLERLSPRVIFKVKKVSRISGDFRKPRLTIACALPKQGKMGDIIDKLTQLGVERIIPLETQRVIANLGEEKKRLRLERWLKIAQSAAQQAKRNTLPIIEPVKDIKKVILESKNYALKLIPTLTGERRTLKEVLQAHKPTNVLVFIGPEGDFTDEEVDLAKQSGFIPVSLGNLVLRVETAAVAVASFIRLYADH